MTKLEVSRLKDQNVLDGVEDMPRHIDLTGKRFGRLVALEKVGNHKTSKCAMWRCKCDCGKEKITNSQCLREGKTLSCGCLYTERTFENVRTHGMHKTSTYQIWAGLIQRCTNPKRKEWKNYGGRGIRVCKRWLKFENFLEDMGIRPEECEIDRIENDGDYFMLNCHWVTKIKNLRSSRHTKLNVSKVKDIKWSLRRANQTYKEIASRFNVTKHAIADIATNRTWRDVNI